jgi:putative ABC transport system permease protein
MFENIALAFQGVWNHKLRSFLTMLGIIIGIASLITIVSTIKGTNDQIKANLIGAGTDVVNVELYENGNPVELGWSDLPSGVSVITEQTRQSLTELEGVEDAALYNSRTYSDGIFFRNTAFNGNLYGVDSHYLTVNGYTIVCGRNFTADDFARGRKVLLLQDKSVSTLFSGENPLGKTVEIKGEPFTVIGAVAQKSSFTPSISSISDYYTYADTSGGSAFVPINCWPLLYRYDEPQSVAVRAASTDDMTKAGKNVAASLTASQILGGNCTYESRDLLEQAKQLQDLSASTNRQLIWIASISLLVGGIGVMNIMLVSVTERTREIGLKKAIGAKRRRILWQFLTEAAVLTSMGGILGVIAGVVLAKLLAQVMTTPVAISVPAIIVAVVFSMIIGIVFGLLPAVKASKLNPIEALRRE